MKDNQFTERIFQTLKSYKNPVDVLKLARLIGIKSDNSHITQRFIMGLLEDDCRFSYDPQKGWTVRDGSHTSSHEKDDSIDVALGKNQSFIVLAATFRNFSSISSILIEQLAAQEIVQLKRSRCFGPHTLIYEEKTAISEELSPVHYCHAFKDFLSFCRGLPVVIWKGTQAIELINIFASHEGIGCFNPIIIPLSTVVKFLYPDRRNQRLEEYLEDSDWRGYSTDNIKYRLDILSGLFIDFSIMSAEKSHESLHDWLISKSIQNQGFNFEQVEFDEKFLLDIPQSPGVYTMCDHSGSIIYIGKSKNLHQRINSYFITPDQLSTKTRQLINELKTIYFSITGSELTAEIIEADLIQKHQPRFNIKIEFNDHDNIDHRNCFMILYGPHPQTRELHLVNKQMKYCSLIISPLDSEPSICVTQMINFFENDLIPYREDNLIVSDSISCFAYLLFHRWWRRNNESIPLYDYSLLSSLDIEKIIRSTFDDTFSPNTRYQ